MNERERKLLRDTETDSGYENKARAAARQLGLTLSIGNPENECPPWRSKGQRCDHIHGYRYLVTLHKRGKRLTFLFWNSRDDADKGIDPGYYDILACVSSDSSMPTDPDEVVVELGEMKPSQAIAAAKFAARLQRFFSPDELQVLSEVS